MFRMSALRDCLRALLACGVVLGAIACSCSLPPRLSECEVRDGAAALHIDVKCRKTIQCTAFSGMAVSDVEILEVFKDNTDLYLAEGDVVSVESRLEGNLCGFSLETATEYIVFVNQIGMPDRNSTKLSTRNGPDGPELMPRADDDVVCHAFDADLSTNLCAGNIRSPSLENLEELRDGCS